MDDNILSIISKAVDAQDTIGDVLAALGKTDDRPPLEGTVVTIMMLGGLINQLIEWYKVSVEDYNAWAEANGKPTVVLKDDLDKFMEEGA